MGRVAYESATESAKLLSIAAAFLFNAYVGAISAHRYILAGTIGCLGAFVLLGFTEMDLRNRDLTRAGEATMRDVEDRLARKCSLPSLRIIEAIDLPRHPWLSMGKIIRTIHISVGFVFMGAGIYAFVLLDRACIAHSYLARVQWHQITRIVLVRRNSNALLANNEAVTSADLEYPVHATAARREPIALSSDQNRTQSGFATGHQ